MSATLTILDLDEAVAQKLRAQASNHGRSMEAEAREILVRAISGAEHMSPPITHLSNRQPFLDLAGSMDGTSDLSAKRGFEA